jgi:PAS domain S-box-containing protein
MDSLKSDWMVHDPGAADFARIYLRELDPLSDKLEAQLVDHPLFGPLMRSMSPEQRDASRADSRTRLLGAFAGDWASYADKMRSDGATYAAFGLTFSDWFNLVTTWSRLFVPLLVEDLVSSPARLTAALGTMQSFLDGALSSIGEAYILASEGKLRRSEEDLRATLDSIGDAIIATDGAGHIHRINEVAARLMGASAPEAEGRPLDELWKARPDPAVEGESGALELTRPDGTRTPILASRAPIARASAGKPGEVIVFRDVTAARRRENELRRWEALFQSMPWGVCITDLSGGNVALCNDAFAGLYGLDADAVRGKAIESLYDPSELVRVRDAYRSSAREAGRASFESIHVRADGSRFPVLVDAARLPGVDGGDTWALSVRDLTERKQFEALRARGAELETENRRVQEASRMKSEFLANMSHELRTPLNSILGFSELLYEGEVGELADKQREFIGDIYTSGKHLLRLINDVLDLSKVEAGKMEFYPEQADLRQLLQEVTGVLRGVAGDKGIVPTVEIAPSLGAVHLDAGRLKQVLYNYLSNALKFSPKNGRVHVSARPDGHKSFRIEVTDEGPGISEANQRRLFMEFEQLDPGPTKTHGGTGLGLALTRRLVEAQGGSVGVKSTVGGGSTFHATLPIYSPARGSLPQPRRIPGAYAEAPRVLVIEDDPADQDRIIAALVGAGYAVDTAATGAQALRAASERTYDAITLDLLLPDANGLQILGALRELPGSRELPVIVISVVSEQVTGGFVVHEVLQKPLQSENLLSSLSRARVVPPGIGPVLVVEDDESSAKLMITSLEQLGFRAVVARDGEQALDRARAERPAAVVLDLMMPNLDGFGFLQRFRMEAAWARIPVLVWTVKDLSADEHRELLRSASAVLPKNGTGARALVETIRAQLPGAKPQAAR